MSTQTILEEIKAVEIVALADPAQIGRKFVNQTVRFQCADRAKFNRTEIASLIKDHIVLGRMTVCEYLLYQHKFNPYTTVDELIGDIQLLFSGEFNKLSHVRSHNKMSVEDIMKEHQ